MPKETLTYEDRTATVVGGKGALGSKVVGLMRPMGFREVQICEEGDPFTEFAGRSTDIFFAVDDTQIRDMLQASREYLTPNQTILDGSSVKARLITMYRELDGMGISVASTHLGAVPSQPLRGIKVWVCDVGPNSERAKRLAFDIFLSANSSLKSITIEDHANVEFDQALTMSMMHAAAAALRNADYALGDFDSYATLSAELFGLSIGRILGQGTGVPSEIIYNQPRKHEIIERVKEGVIGLEAVLDDRDGIRDFMQANIDFHNQTGMVNEIFRRGGVIGARNANLRMHSFRFRITNDGHGKLLDYLVPFDLEGANLTAIDSIPGVATPIELEWGADPDGVVEFDVGIDPKTIDPAKEQRIKGMLQSMGAVIIK